MANITAIADGTFIGHAVASQFDPSVFMALNISESLIACKGFNGPDILSRHLFLYHTKKSEVGETTKFIYTYAIAHHLKDKQSSGKTLTLEDFRFDQKLIDELVRLADTKLNGQTAGCGPAQRSFPLALCEYIADDDLFQISLQEAKLTHFNPIAGQTAGICNVIIRNLIRKPDFSSAITEAFKVANLHEHLDQVSYGFHRRPNLNSDPQPGYAPAVLNAALYYTAKARNAGEAISDAHANSKFFCSSLVGIFSGAVWGIESALYENMIKDTHLIMLRKAANDLAALWKSKVNDISS